MSKRSTRPAVRTLSLCGLATVLVGAACGSSKEPGRGLAGVGGAADPWAAPAGDRGTTSSGASGTSSTSTDADGGLGGLGGGDLQQLLGNVVENLKKPGPYEAPAQGPGASADAPRPMKRARSLSKVAVARRPGSGPSSCTRTCR